MESPFLQLELANPDSRDQNTWIAEARSRLASTRGPISGYGASTGVIDVSDQRYQNAVDGMENGMEDLEMETSPFR